MTPSKIEKRLFLGTRGWTGDYLKKDFYPLAMKPTYYLRYYGAHFNMSEVVSTSKSLPYSSTVDHWYLNSPADFLFCPHLPLHELGSDTTAKSISTEQFVDRMRLLRGKLGPVILNLVRVSSETEKRKVLELAARLPESYRFVLAGEGRGSVFEKEAEKILGANRVTMAVELTVNEKEFENTDAGFFVYWYLHLEERVNKKLASRFVPMLGERIIRLVSENKYVFLVLTAKRYEPIGLVREQLCKFLSD
ncbi:MAG: hypothetical protein DRG59_02855 [Deltaproteobacteria bacterium]|nr:MAG: hypothetical protein DRG59_02855 [Deltaproteobacteria bacterium]